MKKFGLIGFPLKHSFSVRYFAEKFSREGIAGCRYDNYPIENIAELTGLISSDPEIAGLNVTIPYKEQVMPFLTGIDPEAREIGAVNTLKISRGNEMISIEGYNSDVYGFRESVSPLLSGREKYAIILGTGGSSKAVEYVLKNLGMEVFFVSRNPRRKDHISYPDLNRQMMSVPSVIVNASPVGMYPVTDACPDIPYEWITSEHVLFDLVYNPEETLFLQKGRERGARTKNGLQMLHLQAERSWEIWNRPT
jgi:shikimate dehydrogenase